MVPHRPVRRRAVPDRDEFMMGDDHELLRDICHAMGREFDPYPPPDRTGLEVAARAWLAWWEANR